MKPLSRSRRCWAAAAVWLLGIIASALFAWWNMAAAARDAENRLISEAGRTASQISSLLSTHISSLNAEALKAFVASAMEDERMYAILIRTNQGLQEGARRNYLWEPVAWDDEIAENCVQGMDPIRVHGRAAGTVEIWLSPRLNSEEITLLKHREEIRFAAFAAILTLALALLLWHWGCLRYVTRLLKGKKSGEEKVEPVRRPAPQPPDTDTSRWINPAEGIKFCLSHASWPILGGMFRQTFHRAPALMSSLYADGELPALCHLGRVLEQAAPIIGAAPLEEAAREMQAILNDPENRLAASAVDNCAQVLSKTLAALGHDVSPTGNARESGDMPQQEA